MSLRKIALALLVAGATAGAAAAATAQRWIHVHVDEEDGTGARVTLNLPIGLVEAALPMVDSDSFRGGKGARIRVNGEDFDCRQLRNLWAALREAQDAPYAIVEERDQTVRVEKSGGFMLIGVTPKNAHGDRVNMRVPLPVVDALLSGSDDEIDLGAALRALADSGATGELVAVDDDKTTVRIWIDDRADSR
jgi:hypothetical protein